MIYVLQEHFTKRVVNAFTRKLQLFTFIKKHNINLYQHDIILCWYMNNKLITIPGYQIMKYETEKMPTWNN